MLSTVCPCCDTTCPGDVTLEDHGVCIDCHEEMLNGERCQICWSTEHSTDKCPEWEKEVE